MYSKNQHHDQPGTKRRTILNAQDIHMSRLIYQRGSIYEASYPVSNGLDRGERSTYHRRIAVRFLKCSISCSKSAKPNPAKHSGSKGEPILPSRQGKCKP